MALRAARDDDWAAVTGLPAPGDWFGLVADRPGLIDGLGAIYRDTEDRWWITFQRTPGVSMVKTAHAGAKRLLTMARGRGIAVNALAQPGIDGADRWLARLGFEATQETKEGHTIWRTPSRC